MTNQSSFWLRYFLDIDKISSNGVKLMDWHRTLRIVLRPEKKGYVWATPISDSSGDVATQEGNDKYDKHFVDENSVQCIMIACMSPELQK